MTYNILKVPSFKAWINIGHSKEERANKQPVNISITFLFQKLLQACKDDNIEGTICYDKLIKHISLKIQDTEFHLIEKFCYFIFENVEAFLQDKKYDKVLLKVEVIKLFTPLEHLHQGMSFTCFSKELINIIKV